MSLIKRKEALEDRIARGERTLDQLAASLASELLDDYDLENAIIETSVLLASYRFTHADKPLLKTASKLLSLADSSLASARSFIRYTRIDLGNWYLKLKMHDAALKLYDQALDGDTNLERVATAKLNISKVHLANNHLSAAIDVLDQIKIDKLGSNKKINAILGARVRILLKLGFYTLADRYSAEFRDSDLKSIEMLYLSYTCRCLLGHKERFADVISNLDNLQNKKAKATIELEELGVQILMSPRKSLNLTGKKQRIKFLTELSANSGLGRLIESVLYWRKQGAVDNVVDVVCDELNSSNGLYVQRLIPELVDRAVYLRNFEFAWKLIETIRYEVCNHRKCMSQELITLWSEEDSVFEDWLKEVETTIPEKTRDRESSAGLSFFKTK